MASHGAATLHPCWQCPDHARTDHLAPHRASFESERRFSFESDDWRSVTETGGYARLSGDWTAPPPPDGAPPAAEWPLEAAGPEIMHALSTLQEETIAEAAAGPADDAAGRTPPRISSRLQSRPVPAPRSLSVQSSTAQHIGDVSEVRLSEAGSLPAATTSSADEQASSSGGASPPSRPDSGLRRAPRKGQGPVEGHRMSPAVIAAIAEWCWRRRATAGMSGHDNAASCSTGGRRRWPSGPAQPAAPALAGASARLGASAKLRSRQRALPPIPLAEGADTGAGGHRHQRGFSSLASSLSSGLQSSGLARTSIRAESQLSASADMGASSLDHPAGDGGVVSSEEHSVSVSDTAQTTGDASGELLGDGDFELLRRVPGIRTGRRVSFDASLGRASTDDDATGGGSGDAASESPTASSLEPADVSPSLDGGADGVDSPRECAAAAACEDDPAEARGATSGPAAAAAARPELPELHSPACTTVVRCYSPTYP